jgi:lipopolysaccharide/colanic/teichoic acid biosynthesis glycosyltransferase
MVATINQQQYKRRPKLREFISEFSLFLSDLFIIFFSLLLVTSIKTYSDTGTLVFSDVLYSCLKLYPMYIIISCIFFYERIYTHRFDFWHETRKIIKSLLLSFFSIITFGVLINDSSNYPVSILCCSFVLIGILVPLSKLYLKKKLFQLGYWKKGVKLLSNTAYLESEIFGNPYLGYIKSKRKEADLVFIDSYKKDPAELKKLLEKEIHTKQSVLFVPVFNNYQFTNSDVYELTNTRTNLIVLENKLKSNYRMMVNRTYNLILAIITVPLIMPIIGIIAFLINQDSKGPIFFKQPRLGRNGKNFMVYKFRTMYTEDVQKKLLDVYLEENPHEIENYEIYCKYENDPRITRVGKFLRKTSLDELAQIINVLRGEMNFVGPRPYLVTEKEKMGENNEKVILKVKPGITGLWQVSGRNELTFDERVKLEKWYVQNWSLWRDCVILAKTFGVVLNKVGAR